MVPRLLTSFLTHKRGFHFVRVAHVLNRETTIADMARLLRIGICVLALSSICVGQQTANEKAVWHQEEIYWKTLAQGDKATYMSLWNARFTGWPRFEDHPIDKDGIARSFMPVGQYTLTPLSVREYSHIVVTFYRATLTRNGATRTSRLSHTWMKTPSGWQIIGGMSADDTTSSK